MYRYIHVSIYNSNSGGDFDNEYGASINQGNQVKNQAQNQILNKPSNK
jgi:hypothetical protein